VLYAAGLVAAYALDEGAGTVVQDASGNGNNGTLANATWVSGKFGTGLQFTGAVNSLVTIPDSASLHLSTGMTLEAWVYPTSLNSPGNGWVAAVAKDHPESTSNDIEYALYAAQGTGTGPSTHVLIGSDRGTGSTTKLPLNQWSFIAGTYDGSTLRTYVNGVQVASKSQTGSILSTTDPLRLGGDWDQEMFTGVLDNVRIYNGALTAAQLQTDMTTPVGPVVPTVTSETPAPGATNVSALAPVTATFNESIQPATLAFSLADSQGNPVAGTASYNDTGHVATFTPAAALKGGMTYVATVTGAQDAAGHVMAAPVSWSFTTIAPTVTGETPAPGASNVARTVAPTFTFNESIVSTTIGFTLVSASNQAVGGTISYNDSTHAATFTPTAPLAASTTYMATVTSAADVAGNGLAAPVSWSFTTAAPVLPAVVSETPTINASNVSLTSTVTATFNEAILPSTLTFTVVDPANNPVAGTVQYNASTNTATFTPAAALQPESNYTVTVSGATDALGDVMAAPLVWSFSTASASPSPLTVTSETPAPNATGVSVYASVTAVFSEPIQPGTLNFVLRDDKTNPISATVTYNDATQTATLTPSAPLVAGMTYNAIASDALDAAGNVLEHESWLFTTQLPGTGPYSLFAPTVIPQSPNDSDASPSEVGVKFTADVAGYITGIRFYKGTQNTGAHIGHLWTIGGTLLASATFTGETASGWQQVNFSTPIAIQAGTTYVASYHTTSGHYSEDDYYFKNAGVDNAPLHALKAGVSGANGVYLDTPSTSEFPTKNYESANYYVDVVFDSSAPLGPRATGETPAPGATNAASGSTPTITFNQSVVPSSISFVLNDSANNPVAGTVSYNDATYTATFTPTLPLNPATTYTAIVSGVANSSGVAMASPVTWSFTTATAAADPSVVGQWSSVQSFPLVAINQILLNNGQILMYDGGPACIGSSSATVYNPATGVFTSVPVDNSQDNNDIFCSGAVVLADGRVVVVGGHDCTGTYTGIASLNIYDPSTQTWTRGPDMAYRRWYPTATLLPDGRVLVTAGADKTDLTLVTTPEVYDPVSSTWSQLTTATQTINNYPFMFVLPNGNVLEAGSDEAPLPTKELNLATGTWSVIDPNVVDGSSAVMYRPGKILKAGASCPEEGAVLNQASSANAYVLDMTQPNPHWQQVQSMANARSWLDLTMLPDGNVLATGGSRTIGGVDPSTAVLPAEEWDPDTETWTTMASMATPRMYHSTALLLPDGRVLVAGGGHNYVNNHDYYSAEYYSPPYLFKGARPTITSAPSTVQYGSAFDVQTPDAANIASVCLIKTGAVTHAFDENQRYVPLTFTAADGSLSIQAPADANLATPGYYMLFIVNQQGVPSIAPFVQLPLAASPPAGPSALVATGVSGGGSLRPAASGNNLAAPAAASNEGVPSGHASVAVTVDAITPTVAGSVASLAAAGPGFSDLSLVTADSAQLQIQASSGPGSAVFTQTAGPWLDQLATFTPTLVS
jgi:methionine-rich copper-binding protein CopC